MVSDQDIGQFGFEGGANRGNIGWASASQHNHFGIATQDRLPNVWDLQT